MSERMNIPYFNKNMESVRIIARIHIKDLISEFLEDLKGCRYGDMMARIYETEKKWEEKLK